MALSGLSGGPKCRLQRHTSRNVSPHMRVVAFPSAWKHKEQLAFLLVDRTSLVSGLKYNKRPIQLIKSAMDASYGDMADESTGLELSLFPGCWVPS